MLTFCFGQRWDGKRGGAWEKSMVKEYGCFGDWCGVVLTSEEV